MTFVLTARRLFDARENEIKRNQRIVVESNRIAAVGSKQVVAVPPGYRHIDLGDGTLVPGMIDLHAHPTYYFRRLDICEFGNWTYGDSLITLYATWQLGHDLSAGVTTVRDTGCVNRLSHEIEKARRKGFIKVPRVFACGPLITPTGGHVHDRIGLSRQVDGVDEMRKAVREEIRAGAAFIKIATNGADFLDPDIVSEAARVGKVFNGVEFTQEELTTAVEEAHRAGLKVAFHTRWWPSIKKAIQAGADTIEHGTFMRDEDMRSIADRGIVWVPTISHRVAAAKLSQRWKKEGASEEKLKNRILSHESFDRSRHLFGLALVLGVHIGAGTDIFRPELNFAALVDELEAFVEFGMTPSQALQAATYGNALAIGVEDRIGSLETGKLADIVFVEGDPSRDLNVLRNPKLVVLDGQFVIDKR